MPSIFHQIQVGIDQGRRKASAHRNRANVVKRQPVRRTIKPKGSGAGGTNVEKFDEPSVRRVAKTGKTRVKK